MSAIPDDIRFKAAAPRPVDAIDRKLLGALARDATQSYAELGRIAGLSPAAAHERVKRLRASGRIRDTVARIAPAAVGKTLLTFVHVTTSGWGKDVAAATLELPEVEEAHTVAGDACLILKVRTNGPQALEHLLARLYREPGVVSTRSYVALSTLEEKPVQAECTDWEPPPAP